jgi:PTH1 family peptidyl-tRNA hydrolase
VWIVLGLGNPGRRYEGTRHNVGFLVVDRLAARWGMNASRAQLGAQVDSGQIRSERVVLAKPQSFMNRSGQPAASLLGWYKADTEHAIVVHDDVDLPFGTVRVKSGGGHGGHNGLRDLHRAIGKDYLRVRVGVSRPPEGWDTAAYVLGRWTEAELQELDEVVDLGADAAEELISSGVVAAMNVFNVRRQGGQAHEVEADLGPKGPSIEES